MNLLSLSGLLQTAIIDFSTLSILQEVKSLTLSGGASPYRPLWGSTPPTRLPGVASGLVDYYYLPYEDSFFGNCRGGGGGHDLAKFRVPMIHRFMTSHPVAKLLLCFRAKHKDGRPVLFGFFVILTNRLTELCILNAENIKKVYSRPFKQMSWPNKEVLVLF